MIYPHTTQIISVLYLSISQRVAEVTENKMTLNSLAKILGPTIVGYSSPNPSAEELISEVKKAQMYTFNPMFECYVPLKHKMPVGRILREDNKILALGANLNDAYEMDEWSKTSIVQRQVLKTCIVESIKECIYVPIDQKMDYDVSNRGHHPSRAVPDVKFCIDQNM